MLMTESDQSLSLNLIQVMEKIYQTLPKPVALHQPIFAGNEWRYVQECLDSGYVSSIGSFVTRFEQELSQVTGAHYVVATVNGTSALHISLLLAGILPHHEVLTPALSFIATTNVIRYCQAIPHFVDVNADNLAVDPEKLFEYLKNNTRLVDGQCINQKTQRVIKALCVVHVFGHPADMDPLRQICQEFHLELLEDAAQALGSYYKGVHVGHFGCAGALSFNGNKIMTTGGGGAILTDHPEIAKKARHLTTQAKIPHQWKYEHHELGFNYRMPNINAALGCAQLEKLDYFVQEKRALARIYHQQLSTINQLSLMTEPSYAKSNYWLNAIIFHQENQTQFEKTIDNMLAKQWLVRPLWMLHHRSPMYSSCPRMDLSVSESLENRVLNIPSSTFLKKEFQNEEKKNLCGDKLSC